MSYGTIQAEKMTTESGYSLGAGNASSFKNRIINGDMRIDQRNAGASITPSTNGTMSLDRWKCGLNTGLAASKYSVQQSSTAPAGFSNSVLITSTSAYTVQADDYSTFSQAIEGFNFADFGFGTANAKPITISFQIRSSLTGTFAGWVQNNNADRSYPFTFTINAADTWEAKTVTIAGDTSGTWVGATNSTGLLFGFNLGTGSNRQGTANTWGAGNYRTVSGAVNLIATNAATMYITGVQLEVGTVATSFDFRDYGRELILCQRYLPAITYGGVGYIDMGYIQSANTGNCIWHFPVQTRVAPTGITVTNIGSVSLTTQANGGTWSSVVFNQGTLTTAQWTTTFTASSWGSQINFPFYWSYANSTPNIYFTGCEL